MSNSSSPSAKWFLDFVLAFVAVVASVPITMQQAATEKKFASVAIILAAAFAYRWLWIELRKKVERSIITSSTPPDRLYHHTGVRRHLLRGGIVGITCLLCLWVLMFARESTAKPNQSNKLIIYVADFDGPDQDFGVTETILEQLRELERTDSLVEIRSAPRITPKDGSRRARQIGSDSSASVVIWGWYRKTDSRVRLTVHFEAMDNPCWLKRGIATKTRVGRPDDLACFEMQTMLSSDLHTLALITAGVAHYNAKRYPKTELYLEQALADSTRVDAIIDKKAIAKLLHYRAYSRWQLGDRKAALADYEASLRLCPDNWDAFAGRGKIYAELGSYAQAIANLDTAVALSHGATEAHIERGNIYLLAGHLPDAFRDLNTSISKSDTTGWAYIFRGDAFAELGDTVSALEDYSRATTLKSNCESCAHSRRGAIYLMRFTGDRERHAAAIDTAIAEFTTALKRDPTSSCSYFNRGLSFEHKGSLKQAYRDYSSAIRLSPNFTRPRISRGRIVLYSYRLPEIAISDFDAVLAVDSTNASVYLDRGRARKAVHDGVGAVSDFRHALRLADNLEVREAATEEITSMRRTIAVNR
jgi:tetratricopeptide (TPR) repeat protein